MEPLTEEQRQLAAQYFNCARSAAKQRDREVMPQHDAESIASRALLSCAVNYDCKRGSMTTLVFYSIRNRLREEHSRQSRRANQLEEFFKHHAKWHPVSYTEHHIAEYNEMCEHIDMLLHSSGLSSYQLTVMKLYCRYGSVKKVANELGKRRSSVSEVYYRALRKLRQRVNELGLRFECV